MNTKTALGILSLALALPISPAPAVAQDAALEEIIVTARKREENLQDTPVAVTAMDAVQLRDASVYNLYDLNLAVPNIDVHAANGNSPSANVYIRGVGQRNQGPQIDSGVGIYLDDVYFGRVDGALLDLTDIASVQVLRGPQGTLFGKNTTGGALLFTTNAPEEDFSGSIEVRAGNMDRLDAHAVLNMPLSDRLLSRVALSRVTRDGYVFNGIDGLNYADEDRTNALVKFRWLPSDNLTLDLNFNYSDTDQRVRLQECLPLPSVIGWQAVLLNATHVLPTTGRTYDDFCQDAADFGSDTDVLSDLGGRYVSENTGTSLVIDWDINGELAFKSITAWRTTEAGQDDELDYTALPLLAQTQLQHPEASLTETDQFSQEFQLIGSTSDSRLQYVAGFHYFSEESNGDKAPVIIGPFYPSIMGLLMHTGNATLIETENDAWAVFAQAEWAFNDNWKATLGYRYTDEERKMDRELFITDAPTLDANGSFVFPAFSGAWAVDPVNFQYNPDFGLTSVGVTSGSTEHDDGSLMASLQYQLDSSDHIDAGSWYLTYSEGFLSGGVSEAPGGTLGTFAPEEVENIELGIKLDMLGRRLRVNAALFRADYTNRQLTTIVIDPVFNTPAPATINAEKSTISGLEVETTWLATDRMTLMFNATFNNADIDQFTDTQLRLADPTFPVAPGCTRADLTLIFLDSCTIDRSGENLPRIPEQSYFAAMQWDIDTSAGLIIPRIQASLKQDVEYCFDATSCVLGLWNVDEQFDLSARVSWVSNSGEWTGSIYGNNLTDERYVVGGFALSESSGVGGYGTNIPRTYGVEVRYSF